MTRVRPVTVLFAAGVTLLVISAAFGLGGLRVNVTPSYALGLWRIVPLGREIAVNDRIFICPPATSVFTVARERGYLRQGLCPGWLSPLIKTVVAVGGQCVVINRAITIDGVELAHSSVRLADGEGRALAPSHSGVVPPEHLFLFSEFAGSYDSRYFGPIPADGTLGLAQPVLVFSP